MILEIKLDKYAWHPLNDVFTTGFIWENEQRVVEGELTKYISAAAGDFARFSAMMKSLNGQVSIVVQKNEEIWLFTSYTWSFPIFYVNHQGRIIITDSPESLPDNLEGISLNTEAAQYFLHFGATPVSETLIKEISQVRPGEIVRISLQNEEPSITKIPVIDFLQFSRGKEEKEFKTPEETREIFHSVFEKYGSFLKNRNILLPLTSGYDSRLLACLVKEYGLSRIICATWGRSDSSEKERAEKVASTLGFPHIFVAYDQIVTEDFTRNEEFSGYLDYAGHLSSMPFLQDYFAIKYLLEHHVIDHQTVVIPGHPGDFLRGAHLFPSLPGLTNKEIAETILSRFGTSYPSSWTDRNKIIRKIVNSYFEQIHESAENYAFRDASGNDITYPDADYLLQDKISGFNFWDYEERQCKFIGNSSLVYSYFNLEFLLPLFDRELLGYFLQLPTQQRLGSKLYNETLESFFFKPHRLDFGLKSRIEPVLHFQAVKEKIIRNIPGFLKKWHYPVKDDIYYRELTSQLRASVPEVRFRNPLKPHFYNCYLTQYYLHRVLHQLTMKPQQ